MHLVVSQRGDGGSIQSTTQSPVTASATWTPTTADTPYEPKWAIAAGYLDTRLRPTLVAWLAIHLCWEHPSKNP